MKKIKFKFEYVPLSDEQIDRHKSFDQLMAAYTLHPKPSWKSRLLGNKFTVYTAGIITGAVMTASLWWGITQFNSQDRFVERNKTSKEQIQLNQSTAPVSSEHNPGEERKISLNDSLKNNNEKASSIRSGNESQSNTAASSVSSGEVVTTGTSSSKKEVSESKKQETSEDRINDLVIAKVSSEDNQQKQKEISEKQTLPEKQGADEFKLPSYPITQADSTSSAIKSFDTLNYKQGMVLGDSGFVATPQDSSVKKKLILLPKIDVSDEWNASKNAVSKVADSVAIKTGSFFSRLFKSDSSKKIKETEPNSLANDQLPDSFKHRFAQITFVSPIGSDGVDAKLYMHNLSFNVLQGFNGAVSGFELGGLANVDAGYVTGVQIAGIANHAVGDVKGVQIGGLYSSGRNLMGFQTGGLVSVATGNVQGVQVGGVTNMCGDTLNGLQIGGVVNLAIGKSFSHSWQIAGVSNISGGKSKGGQISGVFNFSSQRTGLQIATINFATKMRGFQLGVINLSDTIEGDAVGIISMSRNGQHHVDLFGGEILYSSVAIKLGTPHVYNVFAVGVAPRQDTVRLGFGFGLGGQIPVSQKFFMNIDGICWTIHDNNLKDWEEINLWNEIRFTAGFQFTKGFAGYLGPTLNVQVYDPRYAAIAPYTVYESHNSTPLVDGWVGFVVGLQFF